MWKEGEVSQLEMYQALAPADLAEYGIRPGANYLHFPEDTPYHAWEHVVRRLQGVESAIMWWLGDALNFGERKYGEKYSQATEETPFTGGTLRNAAWVCARVPLSLRSDKLGFHHHKEVAPLDPDAQVALLAAAEKGGLTVRELRQAVYTYRAALATTAGKVLPSGVYDVIYADPPWEYRQGTTTPTRNIEEHYPTMPLEAICALEVPVLAAKDAVLFLWATSPKLHEAMQVIEAWGFEYRTSLVWIKPNYGLGHYFRIQHELLLVGIKGKPGTPADGTQPRSVLQAPNPRHSQKPDEVYGYIEQMYPGRRYLELFARSQMPGWTAWGNEV